VAENERSARGRFEWDPELQREGHYALLLAVLNRLRPEAAFALLQAQPTPPLSDGDCADIRRMRRSGLRWKQLEGIYGCTAAALRSACAQEKHDTTC
jgi:hypothetical protein